MHRLLQIYRAKIYATFQREGNQLTSILTIPESNYALIDFTKHVWEVITCKSLNRKVQKINLLRKKKPSSSVRCLYVLFMCFISYFIAVLKKLPVWSLVQSGEVRWSVFLKTQTKISLNSAGKILNNLCPYAPPPTIATTFKKHTPCTLICLIYHSKCTFRVFPLSCSLNCPLIVVNRSNLTGKLQYVPLLCHTGKRILTGSVRKYRS
jgi:hypothetical protein